MKTRSHEFTDACWNADFILVWPVDAAALCRFLKRRLPKADLADICGEKEGFAGWSQTYDGHNVIALSHWDGGIEDLGTLSHECVHAAMDILLTCGVVLTQENHESLAYLQDSLFRRCLAALRAKRR